MDASRNPTAIVDSLDPDVIAERLAELDREADALRVLLRAARARQRGRRRAEPQPAKTPANQAEDAHA